MEIHTGVEALQGQTAEMSQSIEQAESRIGDVAGATQNIQSGVQSLQRQNTHISNAMEQAKLRMSHVTIVSKGGD
jgi:peptidoglycan hydrolase CwlO-like protein